VWPTNVVGALAPLTAPNATTIEAFSWDGVNARYLGPLPCPVLTKSANYTASTADCILQASASGGDVTLSLPPLPGGKFWTITRTDTSTNTLSIEGSGGLVNGESSISLGIHATTVCHSDGTNLWCTTPGAEFVQSIVVNGCAASSTCTFTYPVPYSTLNACVCSGEGGSCNIASKSTTACTINTSGATPYDFMVSGIP
jgi:hypothetical protein